MNQGFAHPIWAEELIDFDVKRIKTVPEERCFVKDVRCANPADF